MIGRPLGRLIFKKIKLFKTVGLDKTTKADFT